MEVFLRSSRCHPLLFRSSPTIPLSARVGLTSQSRRHYAAHAFDSGLQKSDKKHHTSTNTVPGENGPRGVLDSKGKKSAQFKRLPEEQEEISMEKKLKDLETLTVMENFAPFDVWAQPVKTFDLHIPSYKSKRKNATISDHLSALWTNQQNWFRNAVALFRMAQEKAFPGVKVKSPLSRQLFSVEKTPWLGPFRHMALDTYRQIMQAVASHDEKTIKKLTAAAHQAHLLKLIRAQDPSRVYVWNFHGENSPCKVVSLRATQAHMGREPPKFGNRLIVQALVKFDTMQSLQVYSKRGDLLQGDGKPKNVVEYLVFQKRMWYDAPWVIRDQIYEGLEGKYKSLSTE